MLLDTLGIFESLSTRSAICEKSAPIIRKLVQIAVRRAPVAAVNFASPPYATPSVSNSQHNNANGMPDNIMSGSEGSIDPEMSALVGRLHPDQWLNPGMMSWSEWSFLTSDANLNMTPTSES